MHSTKRRAADLPFLGYGVGLRRAHWDALLADHAGVDFVEILSENFMGAGGRKRAVLEQVSAALPVVLHGTALSIGSVAPLDEDYLAALKALLEATDARWFSDHLCFSSAFGVEYHDLMPVPFTEEALDHVAARVRRVQSIAPDRPFLLENPSYYIEYGDSEMTEAEFLAELCARADCGLLLDVNNVYVNARNHGYDARAFVDALPLDRVGQIHMAGHHDLGHVIIDTHGAHVVDPVLDLFRYVLERTGPVTTLLEWDNEIPSYDVLRAESRKIRAAGEAVTGEVTPWRR